MVKRLSKSRRSAILEHLLALEKQIRKEFGGDSADGRMSRAVPLREIDGPSSSLRHGERERDDRGRIVPSEFTTRSMH